MRIPALVVALAAAAAAAAGPETAVIRSGVPWYDTDGNRVFAGGANMYVEGGVYYLIGEGKKVLSGVSMSWGGGARSCRVWLSTQAARSAALHAAAAHCRPHPTPAPACAGHLCVLQSVQQHGPSGLEVRRLRAQQQVRALPGRPAPRSRRRKPAPRARPLSTGRLDLASARRRHPPALCSDILAPPPFDKEPYYRMERPKLMRNPTTKKYLLWFHCDTDGFAMRSVGVLTADAVTGPFKFVTPCFRPDGQDSYDMGTFYDDPALGGDGHAYLIRSVGNKYAGISQLTADWTGTTPAGIVSAGPDMEGQALMRDVNGTLHAAGSHLTGWASNAAQFVTSPNASLVGAQWVNNYNPSSSSNTYDSQSTFIFPFVHADGHVTHIWMADRWNENGPGGLDNMTAIWLPLLPPSGPAPATPAPGWVFVLDICLTAPAFLLSPSDASVTHVTTGLCVSQSPDGANRGALELAACSAADPLQRWHAAGGGSGAVTSTPHARDAGCVSWNVANQQLVAGNPIIAYACGSPPAWNEAFELPAAGAPGLVTADDGNGNPSTLCAAVVPPTNPSKWTLPWFDAWSLKDF